jgi:amino acid transporter
MGVKATGLDPGRGLPRRLGTGALAFYGVGLILGAGIYSILGEAAKVAGTALWQSFLLGSLAALATGLSYAELATMFPRAGAEVVYAREAWPRASWLSGVVGWTLVGASLAAAAAVALAFAGYASRFVGAHPWLLAAGLVAAAVAVNLLGVGKASSANVAFTLVEAAGLVAVVAVATRDPGFWRAFAAPPHPGVLAGAGLVFFAYLGFEDIANLAEEATDPARSLPRAILAAVAVSTLLYVAVAAAATTLLDPARLAASPAPLADAVRAASPRLAGALGGVALFATANTVLVVLTAASRMLYGMARDGIAPAALTADLGRRGTPGAAILVAGAGALAFLPLGGVALAGSVASLLALGAFAFVNAAVIRLRATRPGAARPFRVPLAVGPVPLPCVVGLVVVVILSAQFDRRSYAVAAAVAALAGAAQALAVRRRP